MASNCHTSNPTQAFLVDPSPTNNAAGMIVTANLPSDQTSYEVDSHGVVSDDGRSVEYQITLKASRSSAPNGQLDIQVKDYRQDAAGTLRFAVQLYVYLTDGTACEKKKKEKQVLNGNYKK